MIVVATFALVAILSDVLALWVLIRTSQLTRFQRLAQGVIVLLLPILGAWLVLHLLGQGEPELVRGWVPNDTMNYYVSQILGIESKLAMRAAEHEMEHSLIDSFSGHHGHIGSGDVGGDVGGGGHAGN